jgi:hypothetical protein
VATNWIEITDTAIKIGLGALIGGVFSVALIFATFVKETWSDRRTRRLKHMEDALISAERYLNYMIKHASNASWHYATDVNSTDRKQAKIDFDRSFARWDEAIDDLNTATSRLSLFGLDEPAIKLRDASMLSDKLLRDIEIGGESEQQAKKFEIFRVELGNRRREIIRMLGAAYRN